jgi:transposase
MRRYGDVVQMHEQGMSLRAIARATGVSRVTVGRYIGADTYPEIARRAGTGRILERHRAFITQRCADDCGNVAALLRELRTQGCPVS